MTDEEQTLLLVRGAIATMPEEEQQKVRAAYIALKSAVQEHGDSGVCALVLLGAETAAA